LGATGWVVPEAGTVGGIIGFIVQSTCLKRLLQLAIAGYGLSLMHYK